MGGRHPAIVTLAWALALLPPGLGTAWGQGAPMPRPSKPGFIRAADALLAALGEPGRHSRLPGTDDPAVRAYLAEAQGLTRTLGTAQSPASNLDEFDDLCAKGAKVAVSYSLAGLEDHMTKDMSAAQTASTIQTLQSENVARYFSVMFPALLYTQHCMAVFMPAMEAFMAGLPADQLTDTRREGIRKMRAGVEQQVFGMLRMVADPGLSPKARDRILSQLETDWDGLILTMPSQDRTRIATGLSQLSTTVRSDAKARIAGLGLRVAQVKCGALCSV